jgi:hypothetical protein
MREPTIFEHGGATYKIVPLSALEQLSLFQMLSPLTGPALRLALDGDIGAKIIAVIGMPKSEEKNALINEIVFAVVDFTSVLQSIPPDVTRRIYDATLGTVKRRIEGDKWADVYDTRSGRMMFMELEGFDALRLIVEVAKDQLANFTQGVVSLLTGRLQS